MRNALVFVALILALSACATQPDKGEYIKDPLASLNKCTQQKMGKEAWDAANQADMKEDIVIRDLCLTGRRDEAQTQVMTTLKQFAFTSRYKAWVDCSNEYGARFNRAPMPSLTTDRLTRMMENQEHACDRFNPAQRIERAVSNISTCIKEDVGQKAMDEMQTAGGKLQARTMELCAGGQRDQAQAQFIAEGQKMMEMPAYLAMVNCSRQYASARGAEEPPTFFRSKIDRLIAHQEHICDYPTQ